MTFCNSVIVIIIIIVIIAIIIIIIVIITIIVIIDIVIIIIVISVFILLKRRSLTLRYLSVNLEMCKSADPNCSPIYMRIPGSPVYKPSDTCYIHLHIYKSFTKYLYLQYFHFKYLQKVFQHYKQQYLLCQYFRYLRKSGQASVRSGG